MPDSAISIVLLLGSYDDKTKLLLDDIKEEVAKVFSGKVFAFLLENLEWYSTDRFEVLAEIRSNNQITLYLFEENDLFDVEDLDLEHSEDPDEVVRNRLMKKYNVSVLDKKTLRLKYDWLMKLSLEIFLIRELELTRGGEYLELMHAIYTNQSEKIWFFKNNSVIVSSMLMEYLDKFRVKLRTYINGPDLTKSIIRVIMHSREKD